MQLRLMNSFSQIMRGVDVLVSCVAWVCELVLHRLIVVVLYFGFVMKFWFLFLGRWVKEEV